MTAIRAAGGQGYQGAPGQSQSQSEASSFEHVSGPFNARRSDVAMEELTLAYERLEME